MDQVPVFADPAKPAALCPGPFQHRRGVYEAAALHRSNVLLHPLEHGFKPRADHLMVILAIGIFGNTGSILPLPLLRKIVEQQRDHRLCAVHQLAGIYPFIKIILHVLHVAMHALLQPILQPARIFVELHRFCNAAVVKS